MVKKSEKKGDFKEGDIVKIKTDKDEFHGTIIPSHEENIVLLKLDSGYNIGVEKSKIKSVKKEGSKN